MSTPGERLKETKKVGESIADRVEKLLEHYTRHIIKVVIGNYPDCKFCERLVEMGKVVQDEGKLVRGITRTAQAFGNEAYVLVPKSWLGKKVRVSLIEEV